MTDPNQPTTPAGWYPDGQGGQRWWDGTRWTEHTQPGAPQAPQTPQSGPTAPPAGPTPPQVPGADLPTQVAPNRAADDAAGQPVQAGAPAGYGAPAGGGYGAPQGTGQYGQPGGPSSGQGYVGGLKELLGEEEQENEGTIYLVKEDGDWKVDGNRSDGL